MGKAKQLTPLDLLFWSLKLDYIFVTKIPGLPFFGKFYFVFLKYVIFLKNKLLGLGQQNSAQVFGSRFYYNDVFGLASLQRVYCSGYWLKPLLPEQPTILDVGANVGQFAFFCRQYLKAERVISIEPLADCHKLLELNSGVPSDCICCAISTRGGEIAFHVSNDSSQLSSCIKDHNVTYRESLRVPSIGLDEVAKVHGLEQVDLLKIDTEGSELDVILSGKKHLAKVQAVLVEMSIFRESAGSLFKTGALLEDNGFELAELPLVKDSRPKDIDGFFRRK